MTEMVERVKRTLSNGATITEEVKKRLSILTEDDLGFELMIKLLERKYPSEFSIYIGERENASYDKGFEAGKKEGWDLHVEARDIERLEE